ncbi:MAG: hypothetical protein IKO36_08500 [Bacteroidaceae bacterium]|nr:hypothetical protein [Bacteroidaceae bacterium]
MLNGIKNFLEFLNANWTVIAVLLGLAVALIQRIKVFIGKTDEEKIQIAKKQIKEIMLKMVSEAELDFEDWNKAGAIKRSQVISQIYEMYPILSKVIDQNELIKWLDMEINTSLQTLEDIIDVNKDEG